MTSSWLLFNLSKSCLLLVHELITTCSWLFHDLFTTCSHLDHNLLMSSSWLVHDLIMTCSWLVLDLFMTCSQFDLHLFMSSSLLFFLLPWFVHYSFITCSQLFRTCSWIVYKFVSDCLWLVHDLLLALDLFIIFHDSSMACSQLVLKFQHNLLLCLTLSASFDVRNGYLDIRGTFCHLQDTSPSLPWCLGWCHG